ncbi:PREDICTED: EF-hand calcium-binding domain-containing protein 14 isoform X2 [Miniopterus natalensis]|uniref:EF-hand calcium-binding domain-containing protein 14 isoform X2 n=1 Tax=Miniopterus natalensis TaxID=291302 RepID=UPI0007A719B9|nr:PREDICTED: EF-hand calcium-binding domain-containing protein 14 isoform X2 [Miniopterus natalensis]
MKKRKELNALIGLSGDSRRKKRKKGTGHRLLRTEPPDTDSESSSEEEEEFGLVGNRSCFVKGDYSRCCKICYPLCAFVILAACVVACVGLVWMQVALKEDLDALKEKFRTMESNQKSSFQEIPKLNEELLSKQRELEKIESGELGLNMVWMNITEMNKQISLLNSAVNHLKASVKSAADLISLPATVEGLQKSVAFIGNTLNSVHLAIEAIRKTVDEHKKAMELLQSNMKGERATTLKRESLHQVTSRTDTVKIQSIKKEDSSDSQVSKLREKLQLVTALTDKPESNRPPETTHADSQVSKLREKLQLVTALTNKPESNRPPETTHEEQVQSFTSKPSALPELPQFVIHQTEKAVQLRSVSLPGISSIKDLQDLFHKTGQNMDEKLTYQEIKNSLGSAIPAPESLRVFDADGDGRYSFLELRVAVGV